MLGRVSSVEDDVLLVNEILTDAQLHVAAMEKLRGYFEENPLDNELRPFLIDSYFILKLENMLENEARLYAALGGVDEVPIKQ